LREEALDRTMWRNRFGRGVGPVVRQNTEWMNDLSLTYNGAWLSHKTSICNIKYFVENWTIVIQFQKMKVKTFSKNWCSMLVMLVLVGKLCGQLYLLRWWANTVCLLI
jgi:hypothetical protein